MNSLVKLFVRSRSERVDHARASAARETAHAQARLDRALERQAEADQLTGREALAVGGVVALLVGLTVAQGRAEARRAEEAQRAARVRSSASRGYW